MPQEIPVVPSVRDYTFTTDIVGVKYGFRFHFNTVSGLWYFDIYDDVGAPIVQGVKLVLGCYLGRRSMHPLFKQGVFFVADSTRSGREAGFDDLGTRVKLLYFTIGDLITDAMSP